MGFGNAAGSFMTGFMAGYKFIDDAQKKQLEINALKDKAEAELRAEREKLIENENKRGTELFQEIAKIDNQVQDNILKDSPSPEVSLSIRNNAENTKAQLIQNFNKISDAKTKLYENTPAAKYINQTIDFRDGGFVSITADDKSSTFITPRGSILGLLFKEDSLKPEADRKFVVDKDGYVFKKAEGGQLLRVMPDGITFTPDSDSPLGKQAQLTNINVMPYKAKEPNDNDLYPPNKIDDALKAKLKSVGMIPDADGNFTGLTYADVKAANKTLMGAYTFEAKPMYSKDGKTIISVTNKAEYDNALAKGYSPNKPEKITIPDVKLADYYKSPEFKQGLSFDLWESKQKKIGETSAITEAINLGDIVKQGGTVPNAPQIERQAIPSMTTEEKKQLSEFKAKTNNFKMMETQLTNLDKLIESGKYNKDIIQSFLSEFGKVAPENIMTAFGSKETLIKTYRMDAQLAGIVFGIIKADSGLTVTDAERKLRMEQIFGGLSANTTSRREIFQSYLKSTADSLNLESDTIAGFGGVDTAQQWKNYQKMIRKNPSMQSKYDNPKTNQNAPTFSDKTTQAAFEKHGYAPFTIDGQTYMVDKIKGTLIKVKGK